MSTTCQIGGREVGMLCAAKEHHEAVAKILASSESQRIFLGEPLDPYLDPEVRKAVKEMEASHEGR